SVAVTHGVALAVGGPVLHGEQLRAHPGRPGLPEPGPDLREGLTPGDGAVEHVRHPHPAPDRPGPLHPGRRRVLTPTGTFRAGRVRSLTVLVARAGRATRPRRVTN